MQAEGKAAGIAQFRNRRRAEREHECIANPGKRAKSTFGQRIGMLIGFLALRPVLQCHKGQSGVLSLSGKTETQHAHHALHFGLLEHEAFDLFHDGLRALNRGAWWQLDVHQQRALVFGGQK